MRAGWTGRGRSLRGVRYSSVWAIPSGSGSREARIHTSCAVVVAPILDRAFARWCFTVECDKPSRWAAAFSDPATRTAATFAREGLRRPGRAQRREVATCPFAQSGRHSGATLAPCRRSSTAPACPYREFGPAIGPRGDPSGSSHPIADDVTILGTVRSDVAVSARRVNELCN